MKKIILKDETHKGSLNPFYFLYFVNENKNPTLFANISTHVYMGSAIFKISMKRYGFSGRDYANDLAKNEEVISELLKYLSSNDFKKDVKIAINKRGYETTAESQLLYVLDKTQKGDSIGNLKLNFNEDPDIPFVKGMNYNDFNDFVKINDTFTTTQMKKKNEISSRLEAKIKDEWVNVENIEFKKKQA